jgi:hypothetical protein
MASRKAIGKRIRFAVFARDSFTCRYCGRQSDQIELHIDHIIPVSKGGTNDEANLITACAECNLGKSDKEPDFAQPTETDRLRAAQEMHEQRKAAKRAKATVAAMKQCRQELVNLWCDAFGTAAIDNATLAHVVALARQHGVDAVADWVYATAPHTNANWHDYHRIKYVYGVRRNALHRAGRAA